MENKVELGGAFNICLNNLQIENENLFEYFKEFNVQWYDYGRSAIRNIPIDKNKKVLLPEYICESVINCFDKSKIRFYKIDKQFNIDLENVLSQIDEEVGSILHYFGFLQDESIIDAIKERAQYYEITIIEDTTQSLFSPHKLFGNYTIASVRKWLQIPMGGMLYTTRDNTLPDIDGYIVNQNNSKAYGMILKDMFLKTDYDTNLKYREIFSETENEIDQRDQIYMISDFTKFLISCININNLIVKRKQNAKQLSEGLKKIGIQEIRCYKQNECSLAFPLRVKKRDDFRNYLMENRIYCAVHWPFDGMKAEKRINGLYNSETLISLPIDQRYGKEEIDYMLDVISKYGGELSF